MPSLPCSCVCEEFDIRGNSQTLFNWSYLTIRRKMRAAMLPSHSVPTYTAISHCPAAAFLLLTSQHATQHLFSHVALIVVTNTAARPSAAQPATSPTAEQSASTCHSNR